MPRNYVRKSNRRSWPEENLPAAVNAVKQGLSKRQAAEAYKIPRRTLSRYMDKEANGLALQQPALGSISPVFSTAQEQELVRHIVEMSRSGYGLTRHDIRSHAYLYAEENRIDHPFCRKTELAGRDWLAYFLKRHPELSVRKPEPTSLARLKGFNRESVDLFYDLLRNVFDSAEFPPSRIWNADETGFNTVPTGNTTVLAEKGVRQVPGASSGERGVNTTAIVAMSASGQFLPPMLIFPRKRMNEALKIGAPPETIFACNESGWSTAKTFSQWFDHFLSFARPSQDAPVLLILDGHLSHTRNLDMIEKARQNHVRILTIPPHTSHKLQPLDVAFMEPLKARYNEAIYRFLKRNKGKAVTVYNVAALVNEAFSATASTSTAQNGFRATGIYPLNPRVFSDEDFATADYLNNIAHGNADGSQKEPNILVLQDPQPVVEVETIQLCDQSTSTTEIIVEEFYDTADVLVLDPSLHYSVAEDGTIITHSIATENQIAPSDNTTPTDGSPVLIGNIGESVDSSSTDQPPKKRNKKPAPKRQAKKEQCEELTSSSYRNKLLRESASKEISQIKNKGAQRKTRGRKAATSQNKAEDALCYYCGTCFSATGDGEGWMICIRCKNWYHAQCANDPAGITCDMCV